MFCSLIVYVLFGGLGEGRLAFSTTCKLLGRAGLDRTGIQQHTAALGAVP